ncbi:aldo/keto reductase [Sulfurimonas sp.]|jgi:aryl-alcohol dehydrogenase-like predicted oxidoreductase|uniref:aldo/keto reductase n=1 Tax=Sulfurimonas sp. TaxID=2022749 RepID=UPI0025FE1C3B|nr:aldo/keto reductase [Sulfurimonas sp.]MBT5935250.1 aldo/keto reductase [Sulfurimonas sp.]
MSNFAFGTYRITDENPQHIQALIEAIDSGVTLIDTSSNYMDGGAERAIALALRNFDEDKRDSIEIVSKFGYIQGSNLIAHKEEAFEDVVMFSDDCYHSISTSFMKDQLFKSLSRLEQTKIDCYLVHNPEYFLLDALKRKKDIDEALDTMYDRIFDVFVGLEEQVKAGTVGSYGISSNSFAKENTDVEFLPYEDLITLADKASEFVGNNQHSFTTIELPINLLETEGLKCALWAKENGLRVLTNRPLNAQKEELMFRLADYDESQEYFHHLNELMDVCDNDDLKPLYNLLQQLDENKHKFGWLGDYDSFLYSQIIPHIKTSLENIEEANLDGMLKYIDMFLGEYRKMVAYECSKSTRISLKEELGTSDMPLVKIAIDFLLQEESIDYILVGMRSPSYVQDILSLKY